MRLMSFLLLTRCSTRAPDDLDWSQVVIFETRFLRFRLYVGQVVKEPHTPIPAEDRIIVVGRAHLFRFFEVKHRLLEQWNQHLRRPSRVHLGLGSPLVEESLIVVALVR